MSKFSFIICPPLSLRVKTPKRSLQNKEISKIGRQISDELKQRMQRGRERKGALGKKISPRAQIVKRDKLSTSRFGFPRDGDAKVFVALVTRVTIDTKLHAEAADRDTAATRSHR